MASRSFPQGMVVGCLLGSVLLGLVLFGFLSTPAHADLQEPVWYQWVISEKPGETDRLAVVSLADDRTRNTIPVSSSGNQVEHVGFSDDGTRAWAVAKNTGQIFIFDLTREPAQPRLIQTISDVKDQTGFAHPFNPRPFTLIPGHMLVSLASEPGSSVIEGTADFTNDGELIGVFTGDNAAVLACCPVGFPNQESAAAARK